MKISTFPLVFTTRWFRNLKKLYNVIFFSHWLVSGRLAFSRLNYREEKIIDMWSGIYMIFRSSTSCVTRTTRRMSLVEQEQPIHQEHLSSPPVYSRARVVFWVLLCRYLKKLYNVIFFCHWLVSGRLAFSRFHYQIMSKFKVEFIVLCHW
jgi:hypothetical protein